MNRCVVFASNRGYGLTSSREGLVNCFKTKGWQVVAATADDDESRALRQRGVELAPAIFARGGLSILSDIQGYHRVRQIYANYRPRLVHHFNPKPVILGSLAARRVLGKQVAVVNTITGLGHAFVEGGLTAGLAGLGYRLALSRSDITIFQNADDQALFIERGWIKPSQARLIPGSGVDLSWFSSVARDSHDQNGPVVILLARLLQQKGLPEFVEVARRVRMRWPDARFLVAGEEDLAHPDSVSADWLRSQDGVEYLGRLSDVRPLLAEADLFLFPSYREGTPRVVLEAAASGLPTVGFDVPGVREAVRDGESGYLVPDRDVDALTRQVVKLLESRSLRLKMGRAARRMVEQSFDKRAIEQQYVAVYRQLGVEV